MTLVSPQNRAMGNWRECWWGSTSGRAQPRKPRTGNFQTFKEILYKPNNRPLTSLYTNKFLSLIMDNFGLLTFRPPAQSMTPPPMCAWFSMMFHLYNPSSLSSIGISRRQVQYNVTDNINIFGFLNASATKALCTALKGTRTNHQKNFAFSFRDKLWFPTASVLTIPKDWVFLVCPSHQRLVALCR